MQLAFMTDNTSPTQKGMEVADWPQLTDTVLSFRFILLEVDMLKSLHRYREIKEKYIYNIYRFCICIVVFIILVAVNQNHFLAKMKFVSIFTTTKEVKFGTQAFQVVS
jgi:hypothetical protein